MRSPSWLKLEELLQLVDKRGLGKLDRQQLQELGKLYRAASADLSRARAMNLNQDVQVYLNNLVVRVHNQVYQNSSHRWLDLLDFLWADFPALVQSKILYIAAAMLIFVIPFFVSYFSVLKDIHFAQLEVAQGQPLVSDEMWHMIENHKMWTDPVQHFSAVASSMIATNNIRVAILAYVLGITFGMGTIAVLFTNGLTLGTTLGVCRMHGMAYRLAAFVAPHGVLELTAIFISGGAGLIIGTTLLFPGQLKRIDALKIAGRQASFLFGGCIPILLIAGLIEGFVSPRTDLGSHAKLIVSMATMVFLIVYLFIPRDRIQKVKS
jgi:uncharacterized membrane protein SpoIIM required for sporulation